MNRTKIGIAAHCALIISLAPSLMAQVPSQQQPMTTPAAGSIRIRAATLKFVEDLTVAAQADGLIQEMNADDGKVIQKGQTILKLDDRLVQAEVDVAQQELDAAKIQAEDLSEIKFADATAEVAKVEYEVSLSLREKRSESESDYRKKWLDYFKANLGRDVNRIKHEKEVAAMEVASAKLRAAKTQRELRQVIAPFDGVVAEMKKHQHDWVRAGEPVLRFVSVDKMRARGFIDVEQLNQAGIPAHRILGAPVRLDVHVPGQAARRVENLMVGFVSPIQTPGVGFAMWVELPNEVTRDGQWLFRDGMTAEIEILTGRPTVGNSPNLINR